MVLTALVVLTAPRNDGVDDEGDEPRVGVARVAFWAGAQVNPNQTAVPASPRQPTRDYCPAGRPVDLWGLRVVPGFLSRPPIPRQRVSLSVGSLLYQAAIFVCR